MEGVEERCGLAGDVSQLDVFIHRISIQPQWRRGIHDLVDDDGSDLGAGVGGAEGVGFLGHEMLEAIAGNVAAKRNAVDLRPELEAVAVAGDISAVTGEQVNLLAQRTERESIRADIELAFVKGDKATRRDDGVGWDAVFSGLVVVVGEEPAPDGCRAGNRIVELNGVELRRVGVRQSFVDNHGREAGRGAIKAARRAVESHTRPPTGRVGPGVKRRILITNHQREALAVGRGIPGVIINEIDDRLLERPLEVEVFATVAESASVLAGDVRDRRIARAEGSRIGDEHQVLAGAKVGDGVRGREGEVNAVSEADADEV